MKLYECCLNCYERYPLCHATCPKKAESDRIKEEIKQKKAEAKPCVEYQIKKKEKVVKKVRKRQKK